MNSGSLVSINVSSGGVPKGRVEQCRLTKLGLEGDRQRDLDHHGGPDRAVTLFSSDKVTLLQAEGHPIVVGSLGENLTVAGLDWALFVPGARVNVGEIVLELTTYAAPCRNISGAFIGGDLNRINQKLHPGWSRLYARVLEEGMVQVGDPVSLTARAAP